MAKKCKLAFRWIKNETDSLVNKQKKSGSEVGLSRNQMD